MPDASESRDAADAREHLRQVILERGYRRSETPFTLSSGGVSHDYVDLRRAVSEGADLRLAADVVIATLHAEQIEYDAIGGMTMGADPIAHAVAIFGGTRWYSVRKAEKTHGTGQRIEGAIIGTGVRTVVFEDTTSTGRSLLEAVDVVSGSGATVLAAVTLLDRGANTRATFDRRGVRFLSVFDAADLGIAPIDVPISTE
jgi:orotate phosphoribosyltransferase